MKGLLVGTLLLLLAGCGGEGGGNEVAMPDDEAAMPDDEIMELASDPRVVRLGRIVERADILLVPSVYASYSVLGEVTTESFPVSCSEDTCSGAGVTLGLEASNLTGLFDSKIDIPASEVNLQSRDNGFDTVFVKGDLDAAGIDASDIGGLFPDITITKIPEALGYGFWGEHGVAGLTLADGPFAGQAGIIPFNGDMKVVMPFALGDVSGTNPHGSGSATWRGIADVVAVRTFRRQEGIATLTIPDLSMPAVSVGITVGGNPIGKPGWTGMSLVDGRFVSGVAGNDYLEGNFHGADNSEAYGVFDTGNFTGAFGAKREEEG